MSEHTIFYGDIHNHNGLGYGKGSLERSIDIARTHLDFFAFTGHAAWHDLQAMEGGREQHWLQGFARHNEAWEHIQRLAADHHRPGEFVQFLGYEWHSSAFGDHCVVFPEDHQPLYLPDDVTKLRNFCQERAALMIPHHIAYPTGNRGVNWDVFDPGATTPVVEIYSEHGNAESDRGPRTYFTHSFGGRVTANTAQAALDAGRRFGFVASSDDHRGFPGAYGEGVMAVLAEDLTREAVMRAVRARRTYALTGDRIALRLHANGRDVGQALDPAEQVEVDYDVEGRDELEMVEFVHAGRTVHRVFPEERPTEADAFSAPVQLRLEWGWGPWADLALDRTTDWELDVEVEGGTLRRVFPCLQSGPFDEDRRHRVVRRSANELEVRSYTSRLEAYRQDPNQSAVLEIEGDAATRVHLRLWAPASRDDTVTLGELFDGSAHYATGPFPKESYMVHRLTPLAASRVRGQVLLARDELHLPGYLYARVTQRNGQMAWSSPWFLT